MIIIKIDKIAITQVETVAVRIVDHTVKTKMIAAKIVSIQLAHVMLSLLNIQKRIEFLRIS
jgi:hypothetical protein